MATNVYKKWNEWRNADHADSAVLTRHEIITLLVEIDHLRKERDDLKRRMKALNYGLEERKPVEYSNG